MAKKTQDVHPAIADALLVLGQQIHTARIHRGWSLAQLGSRIHAGPRTVSALEHGSPAVAIGTVFSAARMCGVRLFGAEDAELAALRRRGAEFLTLMPQRVYHSPKDEDDSVLNF